jgi:SAM-dependent methyltransferase
MEVEHGTLACANGHAFPIERGIPRFVPEENYANNFGFQWNRFRLTQLDSHSGHPISHDRFFRSCGWEPAQLRGARVLDVGCGAGRFTEIALSTGATVVAMDYSSAVEACWTNLGHHKNLSVVRADIFALPFAPDSFDFVYCLGVLQHTPDPHAAFRALPKMLRQGGRLAVDVYPKQLRNLFSGKYWVRPLTTRLAQHRLFALVERLVPVLLPLSIAVGRIPLIGRKARQVFPISNYEGVLPLDARQLREWAILDTFDMLGPRHDHPQNAATLRAWFDEAGMGDVVVTRSGHLIGRGTRL